MHLDDLQYCDDIKFLQNCYASILNREPDSEGFVHYMKALKAGRPRAKIVQGFVRSLEGRKRGVKVQGLRSALFWWRVSQMPVFGHALRSIAKRREVGDVQIKIARLEELSKKLVLLAEQDMAAMHVRAARPNVGTHEPSASLSPRAREIFEELRG